MRCWGRLSSGNDDSYFEKEICCSRCKEEIPVLENQDLKIKENRRSTD
jgi:hypothetical protein